MVDLRRLPKKSELVLVFFQADRAVKTPRVKYFGKAKNLPQDLLPEPVTRSRQSIDLVMGLGELRVVIVQSGFGRAAEMNAGVDFASGKYFWFLHADSHFSEDALRSLNTALLNHPDALHYFRIAFINDGGSSIIHSTSGAPVSVRKF